MKKGEIMDVNFENILARLGWGIALLSYSGLFCYLMVKQSKDWPEKVRQTTFLALGAVNAWYWIGYALPGKITLIFDVCTLIGLYVLERRVNHAHVRGPLGLVFDTSGMAFFSILNSVTVLGRRTQSRMPFNDVTSSGKVRRGLKYDRIYKVVSSPIIAEDEGASIFAMKLFNLSAKLVAYTRLTDISKYVEGYENYGKGYDDSSRERESGVEHIQSLQPYLYPQRDPKWRLPLATATYIILPADEEKEEELRAAASQSMVDLRQLTQLEVVALLAQLNNYDILDLQVDPEAVEAVHDLRDFTAPLVLDFGQEMPDQVIVITQDEVKVHLAYMSISLTGKISVGEVARKAAEAGLDFVLDWSPLNPITEANLLESRPVKKITAADQRLAAEYRADRNRPLQARILLVVSNEDPDALEACMKSYISQLKGYARQGLRVSRVRGETELESAYRAAQPVLTPISSSTSMKRSASELQGLLKSVGTMTMDTCTPTSIVLGQTEDGMYRQIDRWSDDGAEIKKPHIMITGDTGAGKTITARWIVLNYLMKLKTSMMELYLSDYKGQGDWAKFILAVAPAFVKVVVVKIQDYLDEEGVHFGEDPLVMLEQIPLAEQIVLVVETDSVDDPKARQLLRRINFWCEKRHRRRFIHLGQEAKTLWLFEEAGVVFGNPRDKLGLFIRRTVKQTRSFGGRAIVTTQGTLDLEGTTSGEWTLGGMVLEQCGTRILHSLEAQSAPTLRKWGVPNALASQVEKLDIGQFILAETAINRFRLITLRMTPRMLEILRAF